MEVGFNSDIEVKGTRYHVQTEDWGVTNPYLVSRVFSDGAVLRSIKTPYAEVLPVEKHKDSRTIRLAMKVQHEQILDLLVSGQLLPK